jgi:hypothetical protein
LFGGSLPTPVLRISAGGAQRTTTKKTKFVFVDEPPLKPSLPHYGLSWPTIAPVDPGLYSSHSQGLKRGKKGLFSSRNSKIPMISAISAPFDARCSKKSYAYIVSAASSLFKNDIQILLPSWQSQEQVVGGSGPVLAVARSRRKIPRKYAK